MAIQIETRNFPALAELQSKQQWVLWCYEEKDGKKTKVPYNARTGGQASTTNQKTWSSYRHVCSQLAKGHTWDKRPYDGIGFVFANGYAGIDFDHCRDLETGEINELTSMRIATLASYSEISPSGTGVHTIVRGSLPTGVKRPEIEMYSSARFFTVTGNHLPETPTTIEDRQEQVTALYEEVAPKKPEKKRTSHKPTPFDQLALDDATLLDIARHAKNGARFDALWRGDWGGYASQSQADQALCNLLAFYTGNDAGRIDSLFRQSGLYREKWDRDDYREGTINHAIDSTEDTYHSGKKPELEEELQESADPLTSPTNLEEALAQIAQLKRQNVTVEKQNVTLKEQNALQAEVIQIVKVKVDAQWEKESTRLLAIKTTLIAMERVEKKQQKTLYEPFRLTITSGVNPQNNKPYKGLAEVLNINRKTVGEAYKTLHKAGQIVQFERSEEHGERTHFEYQLTPMIASRDHACLDKKPGVPKAKQQKKQKQFEGLPVADGKTCEDCSSPNINIICRDCGSVTSLYGEHACSPAQESDPCVKFTHSLSHSAIESEENLHIPFEFPETSSEKNQPDQVSEPAQKTVDFSHLPEEIQTLCSEHNLTPAKEPCSECGCPLVNRLDQCARCAPVRSRPANIPYAEYGSEIIDRVYPRPRPVQTVQFGGKSHAA